MEFLKQEVEGRITVGDEIVLWGCEEAMLDGPHQVAALQEDGEVTLVGVRQNQGTISVIFVNEDE